MVQQQIALSRNEIDQAETVVRRRGPSISMATKEAHNLVAQIKAVAPVNVIDRAIQVHGAAGISDDFPACPDVWLAARQSGSSTDPINEVHLRGIARALKSAGKRAPGE